MCRIRIWWLHNSKVTIGAEVLFRRVTAAKDALTERLSERPAAAAARDTRAVFTCLPARSGSGGRGGRSHPRVSRRRRRDDSADVVQCMIAS